MPDLIPVRDLDVGNDVSARVLLKVLCRNRAEPDQRGLLRSWMRAVHVEAKEARESVLALQFDVKSSK